MKGVCFVCCWFVGAVCACLPAGLLTVLCDRIQGWEWKFLITFLNFLLFLFFSGDVVYLTLFLAF